MSSNFNDIKYNLRKKEFPHSVREALRKSDDILNSIWHGWTQMNKQMDFISDLISEFVFNEIGERRIKRKPLTYLEELELVLTILDHIQFDSSRNVSMRNYLFLLLFPSHKPHRSRFLVMLTSLALSCSTISVLDSAATLLQQVGFESGFSRHFAISLVDGYFLLTNSKSKHIKDLPVLAPLFVANFVTALTEAYKHNSSKEDLKIEMVELFVEWLHVSKTFLLSPLVRNYQATLPPGSILMHPVTPLSGLLRCWINGCAEHKSEDLFSELENLLIETCYTCSKLIDSTMCSSIVTPSDLFSLITLVSNHIDSTSLIDKFTRMMAVMIETKILFINSRDFWKSLSQVPSHTSELLDTIFNHNMIILKRI